MRLMVSEKMPAEEAAALVLEQLREGRPYAHLGGLAFANMEPLDAANYIRSVATIVGEPTLSTDDPASDVWTLDGRTSPSKDRIPYHTDSPYLSHPEDVVSFWSARESGDGGENVILPADRLFSLADTDSQTKDLLEELDALDVDFKMGDQEATGRIVDLEHGAVRFDLRYVMGGRARALASEFSSLAEDSDSIADVISLQEGDALFFNNRTALHARLPYTNPNRLNYRVRVNL